MSARPRRQNAGKNMQKLYGKLDKDDAFCEKYGNFNEATADDEFDDDESLSDSSIAESDEDELGESGEEAEKSDDSDADDGRKKRRIRFRPAAPVPKKVQTPKEADFTPAEPKRPRTVTQPETPVVYDKQLRKTTLEKSAEAVRRRSEVVKKEVRRKKPKRRPMTQEERLEEAKQTEKLNQLSLKRFCEDQLEEKKKRISRKQIQIQGPYVRFISALEKFDPSGCAEGEDSGGLITQNYLIYSDEKLFNETFGRWKCRPKPAVQLRCAVFGTPANYIDPKTQLPFSNVQAYRILQQRYANKSEFTPPMK